MSSLVVKQQQQISTLKSALSKLSLNYSGTLLWKISDFAAKLAEAKSKDGVELVSPPFYTSQYGYKLQASAFLNGNGAGESTHLSVYIKILPGEYDALLRWPFSHSVSFTIFDQTQNTEKVRTRYGRAEEKIFSPRLVCFAALFIYFFLRGNGTPGFLAHR